MPRYTKPQVLEGGEELRLKIARRKTTTPLACTRGKAKCRIASRKVWLPFGSTIAVTRLHPVRRRVSDSPIGCGSTIGRCHDAGGKDAKRINPNLSMLPMSERETQEGIVLRQNGDESLGN
jgi:hypothetical protein